MGNYGPVRLAPPSRIRRHREEKVGSSGRGLVLTTCSLSLWMSIHDLTVPPLKLTTVVCQSLWEEGEELNPSNPRAR